MKIRVAVCQVDMEWEHTARNLERLEPIVAAADADIAVLPEMFATGFKLRPACVAEPADGLVVTTMRRWAAQYGRAVVGSVVVAEQERFRNRMFFVKPSGETAWYDKRHLFRPGGEARDYTPGDRRVVVEYMGFRFLLLICYDLRFPVWSRNRGDYDAILCSASWADDRREVWRTLLRARAIENQCYLAGVNRVGTDPDAFYAGDSALVDFRGATLADAGEREQTLVAEFDSEAQAAFREEFFRTEHPERCRKHVSSIERGASCKRLCMYLKWMVRDDGRGVDFGLWKSIPPAALYLPLDVHTGHMGRALGLLARKQNDWKAVEEITASLRTLDASDPVKYDFALFGAGIDGFLK